MSLRNLGAQTRLAASFQIMSIVSGAIAPPLMGWLAGQHHSMTVCFAIPQLGFIVPTVYGLAYPRLLRRSAAAVCAGGPRAEVVASCDHLRLGNCP